MDLTAAIRLKIDSLRTAKTTRYHALSSTIEREVALLTNQSADLFTKLEDALEADVLGNTSVNPEELKKEQDVVVEVPVQETGDGGVAVTDGTLIRVRLDTPHEI